MDTGLLIVVIIAVVIIALLAVVVARRRRSGGLQTRFGPEYPRTVARAGDRRAADSQLAEREQRGLTGWDWFWVVLAGLLDIGHWAAGASQRNQIPGRRTSEA